MTESWGECWCDCGCVDAGAPDFCNDCYATCVAEASRAYDTCTTDADENADLVEYQSSWAHSWEWHVIPRSEIPAGTPKVD